MFSCPTGAVKFGGGPPIVIPSSSSKVFSKIHFQVSMEQRLFRKKIEKKYCFWVTENFHQTHFSFLFSSHWFIKFWYLKIQRNPLTKLLLDKHRSADPPGLLCFYRYKPLCIAQWGWGLVKTHSRLVINM